MTALALRFYLIGLPFAGVDFLLNYSFYARQNTRTPAIVGVISVGFYFVTALLLKDRIGFLGLVLADSAKQAAHAMIMTILLYRSVGRLRHQRILRTLGLGSLAAILMAVRRCGDRQRCHAACPGRQARVRDDRRVGRRAGAFFYLAALRLFGVDEIAPLVDGLRGRLGARRSD